MISPCTQPSRSRPRHGFTIAELLIALSVTALLALGASSMLFATRSATDPAHDLRQRTLERYVTATRLGAAVRGANRVLGIDGHRLVLWTGDEDGNGRVNLSEMQTLVWDPASSILARCRPDPELLPGDDQTYALSEDFVVISASLESTASYPSEDWCAQITDLVMETDKSPAFDARAIHFRLTLTHEDWSEQLDVVAQLHR